MTEPHPVFNVTWPNEVADFWDNVPPHLCRKLWQVANSMIRISEPGPRATADFWALFSPEEQTQLNDLASAQDRVWRNLK